MVRIFLFLMSFFVLEAQAQPSLHEQSKLLGNPLSLLQTGNADSGTGGTQKIGQETSVQLLGNKVNLLKVGLETGATAMSDSKPVETGPVDKPAAAESGEAPSGMTLNQHDLYIAGVRVWNGNVRIENGALYYAGGVAPTQIPVPLFVYPLGPVLLQLEAGIEFEGLAQAKLALGPSIPIQDSTIHADLSVDLYAAAYLEAYARLLFVKAGVGGRIDVINSSLGFQSIFYLNGLKPRVTNYGYATLFSGSVYGYVDVNLFFGRWTRILGRNFFNWRGKTFNFTPDPGANVQW